MEQVFVFVVYESQKQSAIWPVTGCWHRHKEILILRTDWQDANTFINVAKNKVMFHPHIFV